MWGKDHGGGGMCLQDIFWETYLPFPFPCPLPLHFFQVCRSGKNSVWDSPHSPSPHLLLLQDLTSHTQPIKTEKDLADSTGAGKRQILWSSAPTSTSFSCLTMCWLALTFHPLHQWKAQSYIHYWSPKFSKIALGGIARQCSMLSVANWGCVMVPLACGKVMPAWNHIVWLTFLLSLAC